MAFNDGGYFEQQAMTDALAKLLIEKGIITQQEFMQKIAAERATCQAIFNQDDDAG